LWGKYGTDGSSSSSSSGANAELVHLMYGYDQASNRTYRRDEVARSDDKTFDELYEYDRLNQLKKFHRGLLVDDNCPRPNSDRIDCRIKAVWILAC